MKAVVYNGPYDVQVKDVPDAKIQKPTDVLVRITTTNICGSDLHMYEGRTDLQPGRILGHENVGEVVEVGSAVELVKVGDMVCLPFNVSCGCCENCEKGLTGFCLTANPGFAGAAYGFANMGPYEGGQAELLRVPYADFNCLVLPEDAKEKENDYVMLSDILPTGYHATELANVQPGDSVVVYGAGPVGLMAVMSAFLKGASMVFCVDQHRDRLDLAEKMGAIPIQDVEGNGVLQILEATGGKGVDAGCECVGYQCCDQHRHEIPALTMNHLIASVKATGSIGTVGIFLPKDPGAVDLNAKAGKLAMDFGMSWFKGQSIATGQANVKRYNRKLMKLIHAERLKPSMIISHELALDQAPTGYEQFDQRNPGWTKVVLKPGK